MAVCDRIPSARTPQAMLVLERSFTRFNSSLVENPMPSADDALLPIFALTVNSFALLLLRFLPNYGKTQEDVISALQERGINSADDAQQPESLGIANDLAYRALVRGSVLRVTNDGRVYLSTNGLTEARKRQQRRAMPFWMAAITIAVLMFFLAQFYT